MAGPADCAGSVGRILGGVSQDLILPDSQRSGTICLELGHGRIGKDLAVDLARRAPGKPGGGGSQRAFRRAREVQSQGQGCTIFGTFFCTISRHFGSIF